MIRPTLCGEAVTIAGCKSRYDRSWTPISMAIYEQRKDPESVRMAAFTPDDPADRHAFLVHMSRLRDDPSVVERVIEADGTIAGTIASFRIDDQTEVTYWIDRALWGRGIASAALQSFLSMTTQRPLFARAAADNAASRAGS